MGQIDAPGRDVLGDGPIWDTAAGVLVAIATDTHGIPETRFGGRFLG